ncbi:MAG: hypothetical protein ACE5JK_08395 [Candidatus Omnitrophota bacterium]
MAKMCEKCLKKYDDTQRVCLMCGSKLKREEECKIVCEEEGKTSEEEALKSRYVRTLLFVLVITILILIILYFAFSRGMEFFYKVAEKFLIRY